MEWAVVSHRSVIRRPIDSSEGGGGWLSHKGWNCSRVIIRDAGIEKNKGRGGTWKRGVVKHRVCPPSFGGAGVERGSLTSDGSTPWEKRREVRNCFRKLSAAIHQRPIYHFKGGAGVFGKSRREKRGGGGKGGGWYPHEGFSPSHSRVFRHITS
ncbi:hypothetical protein CEXT_138311 [Caerostris extrusa]|uniref:Uncharacterized protein n=1 Tax=Caerostris extrusa TaxID=172846 RepID=A0AAV4VPS9_CAEEX|nr:hypothetical protein CEXT_138311 [Caerostris extrusa]